MAVAGESQRTLGRDRGSFARQRDIDEFVETLGRYENGEISAEELSVRERDILARLRELHAGASGVVLSSDDLTSVDVVADLGDSTE